MIEHHVHDNARDRNIQPERKCPARNSFVPGVLSFQPAPQGHDDEGDDDDCQDRVRYQNEEIDWADEALTLELLRPESKIVSTQ